MELTIPSKFELCPSNSPYYRQQKQAAIVAIKINHNTTQDSVPQVWWDPLSLS